MALKRRLFTREFKLKVVREVQGGRSVAEVARAYQIHPVLLSRWQNQYLRFGESFRQATTDQEKRIAELERAVGQLTMENMLLKKALQRLDRDRRGI
jgi:transposase